MGLSVGVARTMCGGSHDRFHLGKPLPGLLREEVFDDLFPNVVDSLPGGVYEVVGVEAVVAQVVGEDFEGREVAHPGKALDELFGRQPQGGLAHGVAGQSVGKVPYGADGQQHLLSGQRPLDQPGKSFDNLRNAQPSAGKLRGGLPMTVGHDLSRMLEDPCRAEGQDHAVGLTERLGSGLPCRVHALQGPFGIGIREVAVEGEVPPELSVEKQLFATDRCGLGVAADRCGDRQRIEEHPRWIRDDVEFGVCETFGHGRGETRSEREDAVFISELRPEGRRFDFGAEFHAAKIEISYLCSMILKANCKINLGLDILRRRADGYHDLETVMMPVAGLYDEVEVTRTEDDRATFTQQGLLVDCPPEANICLRAYRLMHDRYGIGGVHIRLDKRVPFGAGLGGGSSDGTAVVMALNELFGLRLSTEELVARAAELGSDTPFFVHNTPQLCTGRGEVMTPFDLDLAGLTLVVVKPAEGVSTREAYAGVHPHIPAIPLARRLRRPVSEWQSTVTNDFESSVFAAHPAIGALKERLLQAGARYASMSGSGSAVFGLFDGPVGTFPLREGEFLHSETLT